VRAWGQTRATRLNNIIETLKQVTQNKVKIGGVEVFKISHPTPDQQKIMKLRGLSSHAFGIFDFS
jgi:hypothetical protein